MLRVTALLFVAKLSLSAAIDKSYDQTAKVCPIFFKYASEQCPDEKAKCKREPTEAEGMAMCDEFTLTACGKDPNAIKHFKGSTCPTYAYKLTYPSCKRGYWDSGCGQPAIKQKATGVKCYGSYDGMNWVDDDKKCMGSKPVLATRTCPATPPCPRCKGCKRDGSCYRTCGNKPGKCNKCDSRDGRMGACCQPGSTSDPIECRLAQFQFSNDKIHSCALLPKDAHLGGLLVDIVERLDDVQEGVDELQKKAPKRALRSNVPDNIAPDVKSIFNKGTNNCAGKKLKFGNVDCVHTPGPQAGANVTKGYKGGMKVGDLKPNTKTYLQSSMCPVNVHWHLGTEHYSVGQYDEFGKGPGGNAAAPDPKYHKRSLAAKAKVRGGYRCHHYNEKDPKFTKKFEWEHCVGMVVGETYEVHWPHSAAGACGTVDQYQTPFYDGVFCNLPLDVFKTLKPQDVANAAGVHGQIFTVVNDESYFYPDMMRGMIIDGEYGQDVAYYTGSTTGTSRNNKICSQYTPVTWQVDRKCHMISASSFDKLCYDMKQQRDDMSDDLHAHGSRELVADKYVANNQVRRKLRGQVAAPKQIHDHAHEHGHEHGHEHQQWY